MVWYSGPQNGKPHLTAAAGGLVNPLLSSAHGTCGPDGMSLEKGHQVDQKAEAPLLRRLDETLRIVHPGEGKGPGRPYRSFPVPKGGLQES